MKTNEYPLFGDGFHFGLHHETVEALELKAEHKNERLRTLMVLCKNGNPGGVIDDDLFKKLKFARVLSLSNIGLNELPKTIENLVYIRYLNLSGNQIRSLPKSVCQLLALQTLNLLNCPELVTLPEDMKNLLNLRHLFIDEGGKLYGMPSEFGKLTDLQTLTVFFVRRRAGQGIEELKNLNLLRGSLSIKNLGNVTTESAAIEAGLDKKSHLDTLRLFWGKLPAGIDPNTRDQIIERQAKVFDKLRPHQNLSELEISNYSGKICPDWFSDSSSKFTRISLEGLDYCTMLPSFGQLPLLKLLKIGKMGALVSVGDEFYGDGNAVKFPSLEELEVYNMVELVEWKGWSGSNTCMPRLTKSKIMYCPNLTSIPSYIRSPNSTITGCPGL